MVGLQIQFCWRFGWIEHLVGLGWDGLDIRLDSSGKGWRFGLDWRFGWVWRFSMARLEIWLNWRLG